MVQIVPSVVVHDDELSGSDIEDDEGYDDDDWPFQCPWGHCNEDEDVHGMICLQSKHYYGVSWGSSNSRSRNFKMFGYDVWERGPDDEIIRALGPDEIAYPPADFVPSKDEDDEPEDDPLDAASDEYESDDGDESGEEEPMSVEE